MSTGVIAVRSFHFISRHWEFRSVLRVSWRRWLLCRFLNQGKELPHLSLQKGVPSKGNGICKVFNLPKDPTNLPDPAAQRV